MLVTSDVSDVIDHWQKILNIRHWRIEFKVQDKGTIPNSLMEIKPTRVRLHAMILIKPQCLHLIRIDLEKLLVHELVHLIYDPLAEEHSIQIQYDKDTERRIEHKDRFVRELEKCVEHTSQMLVAMAVNGRLEADLVPTTTYIYKEEWHDTCPLCKGAKFAPSRKSACNRCLGAGYLSKWAAYEEATGEFIVGVDEVGSGKNGKD